MARLIDADALRLMTVQECAGHSIEYAMGWKSCIEWIKGCPTVDAIPVEWLEWRIDHAEREGFVEVAKMLRTVRDWWNDQQDVWQEEKEQEAQK